MSSYAIVLTHNRPELLAQCIDAISPQVDRVHIVDNASDPPVRRALTSWPRNVTVFEDPTQPPNLSKLWNAQMDLIQHIEETHNSLEWNIAFLCDDSIAPEGWFQAAISGMRQFGAAAGCTHAINPIGDFVFKGAHDGDIWNRMTGWAFVLSGEKKLRADESMKWWWCDSDLDWQARLAGGMVISPGPLVHNTHPNGWTAAKPELAEQTGRDRGAFVAKWGSAPW